MFVTSSQLTLICYLSFTESMLFLITCVLVETECGLQMFGYGTYGMGIAQLDGSFYLSTQQQFSPYIL